MQSSLGEDINEGDHEIKQEVIDSNILILNKSSSSSKSKSPESARDVVYS